MTRKRTPETDQGIQGEFTVANYDRMQRHLRDKGWIETEDIIRSGIVAGHALEVGPGPGYLGLEWLSRTEGTRLTGLDISHDMIAMAEKNAAEYGLSERTRYVRSSGARIPFDDDTFDAAFTNGSLHEWEQPIATFGELARVVRPGGRVFVSDLRRDMAALLRWMLWLGTKPRAIRPGLLTSIWAAYTPDELRALVANSALSGCTVGANLLGLHLAGVV